MQHNPYPLNVVRQAIRSLREFHRKGAKSLKENPDPRPGEKYLKAAGARMGVHHVQLRSARNFARIYKRTKLSSLCKSIREHNARFSACHMLRALTSPATKRDSIIADAIEKRWSIAQLDLVIAAQFGPRRRRVGRSPEIGEGKHGALVAIEKICVSWQILLKTLKEKKRVDAALERISGLSDLLNSTNDAINSLSKAIDYELKAHFKDRRSRYDEIEEA